MDLCLLVRVARQTLNTKKRSIESLSPLWPPFTCRVKSACRTNPHSSLCFSMFSVFSGKLKLANARIALS